MRIGLVTDSLGTFHLVNYWKPPPDLALKRLNLDVVTGHLPPISTLDELLENESARNEFAAKIRDHGLEISALNCSGNQLAPGERGKNNDQVVRKTFKLAKLLGIHRIVMMSGLPGGGPDAVYANWITTAWPPEGHEMLRYQWDDVAIPYWNELVKEANNNGIDRICIEQHASQIVYNVETLIRLRDAVGETVGVNFDPSHMLWMGGDPLRGIRRMKGMIYHVHAKDTRVDPENSQINTRLETKPNDQVATRSWNYVTLGYGHGDLWWRDFVIQLRQNGYDDVLSIEHEDFNLPPVDGVRKSVDLLRNVI